MELIKKANELFKKIASLSQKDEVLNPMGTLIAINGVLREWKTVYNESLHGVKDEFGNREFGCTFCNEIMDKSKVNVLYVCEEHFEKYKDGDPSKNPLILHKELEKKLKSFTDMFSYEMDVLRKHTNYDDRFNKIDEKITSIKCCNDRVNSLAVKYLDLEEELKKHRNVEESLYYKEVSEIRLEIQNNIIGLGKSIDLIHGWLKDIVSMSAGWLSENHNNRNSSIYKNNLIRLLGHIKGGKKDIE